MSNSEPKQRSYDCKLMEKIKLKEQCAIGKIDFFIYINEDLNGSSMHKDMF